MKPLPYFLISGLLTLFLLSGCKPGVIDDPKAYFKYLNDPKNGLCVEKTVSGIHYKVKYMPAELLAYNQADGNSGLSRTDKEHLVTSYDQSLTFVVNIGPADGNDFDITRLGVRNYEEFAERIEKMAFGAQDWMRLKAGEKEIMPSITRMENINAMERSRNFLVVFSSEKGTDNDLRNHDLCFSYEDELFNTGVNKFTFKASDIQSIPALKF